EREALAIEARDAVRRREHVREAVEADARILAARRERVLLAKRAVALDEATRGLAEAIEARPRDEEAAAVARDLRLGAVRVAIDRDRDRLRIEEAKARRLEANRVNCCLRLRIGEALPREQELRRGRAQGERRRAVDDGG